MHTAHTAAQGDGPSDTESYGFVGLGHQGAQIVQACVAGGLRPIVYDLRADRVEQVRSARVEVAGSLSDLGRRVTIASVCVFSDDDVRTVVAGPGGLLETMPWGGLIVIHSTCSPGTCAELAALAHERGLVLLDAPVSNGARTESGRALVVLAGGDEEQVRRCAPIFDLFAHTVLHTGEVGSAQLVKLLNNAVFVVHRGATVDALRAARELGLDPDRVRLALQACSASARALPPGDRPLGLAGGGPDLSALAALLRKDLSLLGSALADVRQDAGPLGALARQALDTLLDPLAATARPDPSSRLAVAELPG
ncbi:3-hydroxyisobutyrate dehydrogenase [Parafrankia irregularis]|uniref:3-hydroxyisobutyrate dehydrogenase n=1 Tax=Parafrankia irregularis TaxID=795642 RepID=A0A0S4QDH8_9ACTN|nr:MULTISPECIES: NAD(P)-dependent oxidoreductase [Parafrankia]MBE3199774.1 NAD(P)-dependent oxidoreductase [Parafrankia sp. CH37]CUU53553.1 3-hydroxyisobutyrate dehydrogenase [Parafrankia irregularis]